MAEIVGEVEAIFRYAVKSMRGEALDVASLGWHGLDGDRRLAFRRLDIRGGNPWLSATKLPALALFTPVRPNGRNDDALPTSVSAPEGREMPLFGDALAAEVAGRCGFPVQMMHLRHGMFDEASISVITTDTVREVCRLAEKATDARRFRPNIVVRARRSIPFGEDEWLGGVLTIGDADDAATVTVTARDIRCAMVNIDPDEGTSSPEVLKAVVRANQNCAGVYGTVTRIGRIAIGQTVALHR